MCQFLGPSIVIPLKQEVARWHRLQVEIARVRQKEAARRKESATRRKHDLEHRIRDLKGRPASSGLTRLVKELEKELSDS